MNNLIFNSVQKYIIIMVHRRCKKTGVYMRRKWIYMKTVRCFWTLLGLFCMGCFCLLFYGVHEIQYLPFEAKQSESKMDTVFFGSRNVHNQTPERQSNFHVAIDARPVPQKLKLLDIQRKLIENQNRPPDSAYNFNVSVSDSISLDRNITDTRPLACRSKMYTIQDLPAASIVIPFYNEALSMLLRTIHSILNRTPDPLVQEIILVDDFSSHDYLHETLQDYLRLLPKVRLIRNYQREGLIRSRLRGADISSAPVLVFLDAHTEANVGWLEPLLAEIHRKPNSVVQPFVDGIDVSSLAYSAPATIHRGGFTWDLRYVWMKVPEHIQEAALKDGANYWSATLVGCAIAVDRSYFYSTGAFDSDQIVWGGENLELAFRTWMCGGTVTTVPCSRVGHVFRNLPYREEKHMNVWLATWQKNLMRVADVWMDDYKMYFYSSTRIYAPRRVNLTEPEIYSLAKRKQLRKDLKCKSFAWYLANVASEIPIPPHDAKHYGELTNYRSNACWEVMEDGYLGITFGCFEHKMIVENIFTLSRSGLLLYKDKCVKFMFPTPALKVVSCPVTSGPGSGVGEWRMNFKDDRWGQLQVSLIVDGKISTWCIAQVTSAVEPHKKVQMPHAARCEEQNHFQIWSFDYRFDYIG